MGNRLREWIMKLPPKAMFLFLYFLTPAVLHAAFAKLPIDTLTLAFMVLAVLPFLPWKDILPRLKSVELPGGLKVELQDLEKAAEKAKAVGLLVGPPTSRSVYLEIAPEDPNLALAGLRIEIERRLRDLAAAARVQPGRRGLMAMVADLSGAEALTDDQRSVIQDLLGTLNAAVHGAEVEPRVAQWAFEVGPQLLAGLDARIRQIRPSA